MAGREEGRMPGSWSIKLFLVYLPGLLFYYNKWIWMFGEEIVVILVESN
jgi:hypothetical protein